MLLLSKPQAWILGVGKRSAINIFANLLHQWVYETGMESSQSEQGNFIYLVAFIIIFISQKSSHMAAISGLALSCMRGLEVWLEIPPPNSHTLCTSKVLLLRLWKEGADLRQDGEAIRVTGWEEEQQIRRLRLKCL